MYGRGVREREREREPCGVRERERPWEREREREREELLERERLRDLVEDNHVLQEERKHHDYSPMKPNMHAVHTRP